MPLLLACWPVRGVGKFTSDSAAAAATTATVLAGIRLQLLQLFKVE